MNGPQPGAIAAYLLGLAPMPPPDPQDIAVARFYSQMDNSGAKIVEDGVGEAYHHDKGISKPIIFYIIRELFTILQRMLMFRSHSHLRSLVV